MRKPFAILTLLALVFVAALASGCGLLPAGSKPAPRSETVSDKTPGGALLKYFAARTKTGKMSVKDVDSDGTVSEEQADFWVDGRKFRIDFYRDGNLRISIRSADGKTAYFCDPNKKVAVPAVAGVDNYLRVFTRPKGEGEQLGKDPATGAAQIRYTLKETSNIPGSDNAWYVEDLVYSVKDGRIVSVVQRGGIPHAGEETKLDATTDTFTSLKTGVSIPADTFEIPYPIQNAD